MVAIDAPAIERLALQDAPSGLALSREAGWNQTIEDWCLFLETGSTFGLRGSDGRVIASAALLPSPPVTWISMVLVARTHRRRGFATRLLRYCLDEAARRRLSPWLDATPAGAEVYKAFGFVDSGWGLRRLRRCAASGRMRAGAPPVDVGDLIRADRATLGFDRAHVLGRLAGRKGSRVAGIERALALVRDGDRARHIGPVIAENETAAIPLLRAVIDAEPGPLVVDVANGCSEVDAFLRSRGFGFERSFIRMTQALSFGPLPGGASMAAAGPVFG
jgi:GNAT superfamily N-acetyltransferase